MATPDLSVVIPVFNEAPSLQELYERLTATLEGTGRSYEIIAVDDGSTDGSLAILTNLRKKDSRLRVAPMVRNFGQSPALYAGISLARGSFVFIMDADLQVLPEDLPRLIEKLDEGYECATGWRRDRQDSFMRRTVSRALNWYIGRVTRVPLHDYGCTLKGFRREVVDRMMAFDHRCRYLPVDLVAISGSIAEVDVRHNDRKEGESKYGLFKLTHTAVDLITSITDAPLRMVGAGGALFALGGFAMSLRVLWTRLVYGNLLQLESVIAIFFLLSGIQLLATGTLCAYIGRIYIEVQRKPYFVMRDEVE
jgi:undecaprenyl-phosphate 4-deoxy-4-formamido-L-arabinose transferase